jgi:hypothetical protein
MNQYRFNIFGIVWMMGVFPFDTPETMIYYDSEGEVCLLNESDLSLLARLEKLCDLSPRLATK